eukprot:192294_1
MASNDKRQIKKFTFKQIQEKVAERWEIPEYYDILMEAAVHEDADGMHFNLKHPSFQKLIKLVKEHNENKRNKRNQRKHINKKYHREDLINDKNESELINSVTQLAFDSATEWTVEIKNDEVPFVLESARIGNDKKRVYRANTKNQSTINMDQFWKCIYWCGHNIGKPDIRYFIGEGHIVLYKHTKTKEFYENDRDYNLMFVKFKPLQTEAQRYNKRNVIGFVQYSLPETHPLYNKVPKNCSRCSINYSAFILYQNMNSDDIYATFIAHDFNMGGWVGKAVARHYKMWAIQSIKHFHKICYNVPSIIKSNKSAKYYKHYLIKKKKEKPQANIQADVHVDSNQMKILKIYSRLLNMGVSDDLAMKSAKLFPTDLNSAILYSTDPTNKQHKENKNEEHNIIKKKQQESKQDMNVIIQNDLMELKQNDLKELERQTQELQATIAKDLNAANIIYNNTKPQSNDEPLVFHNIIDTKGADVINEPLCEKKYNTNIMELSCDESVTKQFVNFLKSIKMEKYIDKFKENDCADMESIPHFDDD